MKVLNSYKSLDKVRPICAYIVKRNMDGIAMAGIHRASEILGQSDVLAVLFFILGDRYGDSFLQ